MVIKNLAEVSKEEQSKFIDSFDNVLTDIDGVIWLTWIPIPEASECLDNFRKLGKKVRFITNYAAAPVKVMHDRLIQNNFQADIEDIINPYLATIDYLKKINFQKKIYVISTTQYKSQLREAGFNIAEDPPQTIAETAAAIFQNIQDDAEVGAVLYDFDINLTYLKMQKALTYLKRKECILILGAGDKVLTVGSKGPLIGNEYFYMAIQEISGKEGIQLAKPSSQFNKFVVEKLKITKPERTLFIGDMINEDMGFAAVGGYQKLLVLSGTATIKDVNNWKYPEEYKPDYYIENLTELNKIIKTIHKL